MRAREVVPVAPPEDAHFKRVVEDAQFSVENFERIVPGQRESSAMDLAGSAERILRRFDGIDWPTKMHVEAFRVLENIVVLLREQVCQSGIIVDLRVSIAHQMFDILQRFPGLDADGA